MDRPWSSAAGGGFLEDPVMLDYPVKLGSMLFTVVEPHRGHEVAYNRWYERDHFYAGVMIGPHAFAGRRFVATRREKALRYPTDSPVVPDRAMGSYAAIYWVLDGHHDEWNRWAVDQVKWLHANGRMFAQRDHVYTILARHEWAAYRDPHGVPAEVALDHPFSGLVAIVGRRVRDHSQADLDRWFLEEHLPGVLDGGSVAMCLAFSPLPMLSDSPGDVPRTDDDRFIHLYFLDGDLDTAWKEHFAELGAHLNASGLGEVLWATPFIPTLPGTDTYTDELW